MGNPRNVIEINGKIYDATSGRLVSHPTVEPVRTPQTVDGFTRPTPKKLHTTPDTPAQLTLQPKPAKQREVSPHHKRHSLQKSQTLMRRAVKKPASQTTKAPQITSSRPTLTSHRSARAQHVSRSAYINKFSTLSAHQPVVKRTAALEVKEAPTHHSAPKHHATHHTSAPKPTKSEALFNKALEQAPADKKAPTKHHKKSHRKAKWGASIAAVLLLVGFIAYMNLPNINMQFASTRAGFGATMPGYKPSGFKVDGPISYKAGEVTVAFSSNTDQRNYSVTQAVSSWNSQALQENFLNAKNATYQTAQTNGKTIYMYDNGNATWVNGGVWYQVESNQALSSDQLLKIASSL